MRIGRRPLKEFHPLCQFTNHSAIRRLQIISMDFIETSHATTSSGFPQVSTATSFIRSLEQRLLLLLPETLVSLCGSMARAAAATAVLAICLSRISWCPLSQPPPPPPPDLICCDMRPPNNAGRQKCRKQMHLLLFPLRGRNKIK